MVTTNDLRAYLRAPPDGGEDMSLYLAAARSAARAAGVLEREDDAEYDLMILTVAAWHYENRAGGDPEAVAALRNAMNSFVLSLRYGGGADG